MATGVSFNGARLLQAGAYTRVNAEGLQTSNPGPYNIVCVMGRALGGEPMKAHLLSDPIAALNKFGVGTPLADACRFAFQGSDKGGARAVIAIRTDPTAQATGSLAAVNGGPQIDAVFDDWGAYGNTYTVTFGAGSSDGIKAVIAGKTLAGGDYRNQIDNVTDFTTLVRRINAETPVNLTIASGGTKASQTFSLGTSQVDGRATIVGSQGTTFTSQAYFSHFPASTLVSNESMVASFAATLSWPIASIDTAGNTFTATGNTIAAGNFVRITGTTLPPEIVSGKRYILYGAGNAFTVVDPLATPQSFTISALASNTLTSAGHTLVNGDVVEFGGSTLPTGAVVGRRYFVIAVSGGNFQLAATPSGVAISLSGSSLTDLRVVKVAGNTIVDITGTISGATVTVDPGRVQVSGSNPTSFNGTRETIRSLPAYNVSVTNASISARPLYGSDAAKITLYGTDSWGYSPNRQALPGAVFTIASGIYAGTYQVLAQEFDGADSDKTRVVRKLSDDRKIADGTITTTLAFQAELHFDAPQPASLIQSLSAGNGLLATGGQYLTLKIGDEALFVATEPGDTIEGVAAEFISAINNNSALPVTGTSTYNAVTFTSTITLTAKEPGDNQLAVGLTVNPQSTLIVSNNGNRLLGGSAPQPPRDTSGAIAGVITLSGGYDSTDVYSRYAQALDEVAQYESVYWIVPATDNYSIQQLISEHCTNMSQTAKRRERRLVTGHGLGKTYSEINALATAFNSGRVIYCSSGQRMSDGIGGSKMYPAYMFAARVAGALVAEGVSDTITHTYFPDILQSELQYRSGSLELDAAISAGVLAIEADPSVTRVNRGFRVARAITTYISNSAAAGDITNAFQEISVLTQSDYIAQVIREMQETFFIGGRIDEANFKYIVSAVNQRLAQAKREGDISDYDPGRTTVRRSDQANTAIEVGYAVRPKNGLEFILNTQTLVPYAPQVATAA